MVDWQARDKAMRKERVKFYIWSLIRIMGEEDFYRLMDLSVNTIGDPKISYLFLGALYDVMVPDNAREGIEFLYKKAQKRNEDKND